MTVLDAIRQRVEWATKGPWRWGYWVHRPDLKKQGNIGPYTPYWEFRAEDPTGFEELVLSTADYGTVAELPRPAYDANVVSSTSAGYGGETTIEVRDEDKPLIAHSREDIPALLRVAEAAIEYRRLVPLQGCHKDDADAAQRALSRLLVTMRPLLQEVEE